MGETAPADGIAATLLASRTTTPIAQLKPDLPDQDSRVVRGQVTITWPYNSFTKKAAFLLAEPDVRLRRDKGQVRLELHGPSAKAVSECGIAAGDELIFSLDGVKWAKDESPGRIPGTRVDWQLQFNEKLVLEAKITDSDEIKYLNIDHPTAEPTTDPLIEARRPITPEPAPTVPEVPTTIRKISDFPSNEYASPAFVKRARLSYGALFEGGLDIFDEDGGVKGKGRKRTKFGRDSNAWRYASQSPSPEPSSPVQERMEEDSVMDAAPEPSPKSQMTDEGCQTVEIEMAEAVPKQTEGTVSQAQAGPVPSEPLVSISHESVAQIREVSIQTETAATVPAPRMEPTPADEEEQVPAPREVSPSLPQAAPVEHPQTPPPGGPQDRPAEQPQEKRAEEPRIDAQQSSSPLAKTTLFGTPKALTTSFSMFGASAPAQAESALSLADQVRFGFSHVPQTTRSPIAPPHEPASIRAHDRPEDYPASYLDDAPTPTKYADMDTTLNAADEQREMAVVQGQNLAPEPPMVERFEDGQWEMATQSPRYNPIEGGHFGVDALDEGTRISRGDVPLPSTDMAPTDIPDGLATYGHEAVSDGQSSPSRPEEVEEDGSFVENEETVSDDEVAVDDEEEEDAEYDEYVYGERIEEGDYDQRQYDVPSDDEEGLSEESDEMEMEARERYGDDELYYGEGGGFDEDEDDYDESDEEEEEDDQDEYDMRGYQPRKFQPAAAAALKDPVVISLLSDSEDEDEPVPTPSKPTPASQEIPPQNQVKPTTESEEVAAQDATESAAAATADIEPKQRPSPDNLLSQTHVVDFASRFNEGNVENPAASAAEMEADTTCSSSSPVVELAPGFDVPSTQASADAAEQEAAPSESSSEGLFMTQPRVEVLDEGSNNESDETGEGITDAEGETEPEHQENVVETEDGHVSVEEVEDDKHVSVQSTTQDSDAELPDADDVSFVSQVEIEEVQEAEDQVMDEAGVPSQDAIATGQPDVEVEEIETSHEDVEMTDSFSAHLETAVALQALQQQGTLETVVSEVVSEVVTTETSIEEGLPSSTQDDQTPASAVTDEKAPATEQEEEPPAAVPKEGVDGPTAVPWTPTQSQLSADAKLEVQPMDEEINSEKQEELVNEELISPPETGLRPEAKVLSHKVQIESEETLTRDLVEAKEAPSAEPQLEAEGAIIMEDEVVDGTEEVPSPQRDAITAPQQEALIADSTTTDQPTVADVQMDESQPALLPSYDRNDDREQLATVEESTQQTAEPETPQRSSSPIVEQPADQEIIEQPSSPMVMDVVDEEAMIQAQLSQEHQESPKQAPNQPQPGARSPSPDLSVQLARQAVAAKRAKKAPEPTRRTSPRITRARSNSLQTNRTATPEPEKEDTSVSLARAALASPSKRSAETDGASTKTDHPNSGTTTTKNPFTTMTTAELKTEFTKRLRTDLPESVPLKNLRNHVEKTLDVLAVVVSTPPSAPARAKGGPREFMMTFAVTDPSMSTTGGPGGVAQVAEVQIYRPHRETLPIVKMGDVVLLRGFGVKALSRRGWGLRSGEGSCWAAWDDGNGKGGSQGERDAPQIRGPPVEGWRECLGCVGVLKAWFGGLEDGVRGRIERAGKKLGEGEGKK